jgi:cytochrome c-type biogenesis protein CcmH
MTLFWLSILLLTLLACGCIIFPLWQTRHLDQDKQRIANKAWYTDQLKALQQSLAQKKIDSFRFEQERCALQKDFLLFNSTAVVQEQNPPHRILAVLLTCAFSIAVWCLYQKLGASHTLAAHYAEETTKQQTDARIKMMGGAQSVVRKLKQQLALHPKDAQGWYLLGRIYFSENQFNTARLALERAVQLAPNRQEIVAQMVEASYLSGDTRTQSRLRQALQQAPQDPTLLNVSALLLYQQKKYQQALTIWQNLLPQVPESSDAEQAITTAIAATKKKLAES